MAILSMIHAILPIGLVMLTVFLIIRSRRLPWSRGFAATMAANHADRNKFLRHRKAPAPPHGADDWEQVFETGLSFTDSWENGPEQKSEIQFAFTDNTVYINPEEHG